jgi:hypothetical protein
LLKFYRLKFYRWRGDGNGYKRSAKVRLSLSGLELDRLEQELFALKVALQAASPGQKIEQLPSGLPNEGKNVAAAEGLGLLAGVGLDAPFEIFAAPGSEPVATSCIPEKTEGRKHKRCLYQKYRV